MTFVNYQMNLMTVPKKIFHQVDYLLNIKFLNLKPFNHQKLFKFQIQNNRMLNFHYPNKCFYLNNKKLEK